MTLFQWTGLAILALALFSAASAVISAWRRQRSIARELELRQRQLVREVEILADRRAQKLLAWDGYRKFIVARKEFACDDIVSIWLRPHDGLPIPSYKAGQHLTFRVQIPGQSKPGIRCYSLSDAPGGAGQDVYRISVKRIPAPADTPGTPAGLVSGYWHDIAAAADLVDVRAPKGSFHVDARSERPVILLGGGVGVTPLLSMYLDLARRGSEREVWLFYGVNHKHQLLYPSILRETAQASANFHVRIAFSRPSEECEQGRDFHRHGYVSIDWVKKVIGLPDDFSEIVAYRQPDFYVCGPPAMMHSVIADLDAWCVPESRVHFETFGPSSIPRQVMGEAKGVSRITYSVEFRRTGRVIEWRPDKGSLLETARSHDILLDCGCRCGDCGSCETAVIQGEVGYPDKDPQFELHAGNCLTCIGVPKSDLILDA